MVVGNHQCKVANLNQSKAQFQLELSLAQFSPSLFLISNGYLIFPLLIPQVHGYCWKPNINPFTGAPQTDRVDGSTGEDNQ